MDRNTQDSIKTINTSTHNKKQKERRRKKLSDFKIIVVCVRTFPYTSLTGIMWIKFQNADPSLL